jgi:hypothetical protein
MSELDQTAASLGFFGDDLDPEEITRILGASPTVGVRKGGVWKTSLGAEKFAKSGSWRYKVERRSPGDLDSQIVDTLAALSSDLVAWKDLSNRFGGRFFCGLFMGTANDGLRLDAKTLAAIGDRGLALDLDIYAPDRDPDAP